MGLPFGINGPPNAFTKKQCVCLWVGNACAILCLFPTPTNVNIGLSRLPLTNFQLVHQEPAKNRSAKVNCWIFVGVCWIIFTQTEVTCDQMQLLFRYSDSCQSYLLEYNSHSWGFNLQAEQKKICQCMDSFNLISDLLDLFIMKMTTENIIVVLQWVNTVHIKIHHMATTVHSEQNVKA